MRRMSVSKAGHAKRFRGHVSKTKAMNLRGAPMRGGIRL